MRYDPRDVSEIKVYHEGELVCRATRNGLAPQGSLPLKELQRTRRRRKAELREQERERMEAVNKLVPLGRAKRPESASGKKGKPTPARDQAGPRLKKYRCE